jgi:hypothetical protein
MLKSSWSNVVHSYEYNPEKIEDRDGIVIEEGLIACEKNVPSLIMESKLGVIDVLFLP